MTIFGRKNAENNSKTDSVKVSLEQIIKEQQRFAEQQYKDTSISITQQYLEQQSIYQRSMIQTKMQCYEDSPTNPNLYQICVENIDQTMQKNALSLQYKFAKIDEQDKACQADCQSKLRPSGKDDSYLNCMRTCADNFKNESIKVYEEFYKTHISSLPDFSRLLK